MLDWHSCHQLVFLPTERERCGADLEGRSIDRRQDSKEEVC